MRRDAYVQNDSGWFSALSGHVVDDIIEGARTNQPQSVAPEHLILLDLIGDDSMPVRIVVDEPLHADEQAEWLARVRTKLELPDGRLLVMGGFDPDILGWWRDDHGSDEDGTGVAVTRVPPGTWDVDVYTHVASLNGRALLEERGPAPIGEWFRRDHPDTPVPLWLVRMLDYSGENDPGHEADWRDPAAALVAGRLEIDTTQRGFIGLLFHLHRRPAAEPLDTAPESGVFDRDFGARTLTRCPRGLAAAVEDPDLVGLARRLTGEPVPAESFEWGPRFDVSGTWKTPTYPVLDGAVPLELTRLWHAWAIPALCSDSAPLVEVHVANAPGWEPQHDGPIHVERNGDVTVLGVPANLGGWMVWKTMPAFFATLRDVPDGATIELATALETVDDDNPEVGRCRMAGSVDGGNWLIAASVPAVKRAQLRDALAFMEHLFDKHWLATRTEDERRVFEQAYAEWQLVLGDDVFERNDDVVTFRQVDDIRNLVIVGQWVFRERFADVWSMDGADEVEYDDDAGDDDDE